MLPSVRSMQEGLLRSKKIQHHRSKLFPELVSRLKSQLRIVELGKHLPVKHRTYQQKPSVCTGHNCISIHQSKKILKKFKVQGTNIAYKRSALRVAKVVCQCLHFVCCEIVLIPEDMVVSRPTRSLANSHISHSSIVRRV
jgi:hypothetical protein